MKKNPIVALIYDFDGTLAPGNMQEFGFIQAIGDDIHEFWEKCNNLAKENDASQILTYMFTMLEEARADRISLKRESFMKFGAMVKLFPGVKEWFRLINRVGAELNLDIKHYINSSGLKEMIEGTEIAGEFDHIYSSSYLYDVDGVAYWPAVAVDFTEKTQFLSRINKGIREVYETKRINDYMPEEDRPVPYSRMIYFGDGMTDIPSMSIVKRNGGHSVAIYDGEESKPKALKLIQQGRVDFVCKGDYREGKTAFQVVKAIFHKIKADADLKELLDAHQRLCE